MCVKVIVCNISVVFLDTMQLFTTCQFLLSTASVFIFLHVVSWNTRAYSHFSQFSFSHSSCCSLGLVPPKRTCVNKIGGWMPFLSPNQQCQSTENMTYFRFFFFYFMSVLSGGGCKPTSLSKHSVHGVFNSVTKNEM